MNQSVQKGFTLVELIVVIAIIAVLATIGLVMYSNVQRTARDSKRIQDINAIQNALEQLYTVSNPHAYPIATSNPRADVHVNADPAGGGVLKAIDSYFQTGVPPDDPQYSPTSTFKYFYYSGGATCTTPRYRLCATMEVNTNGNSSNQGASTDNNCFTPTTGTGFYCVSSLAE